MKMILVRCNQCGKEFSKSESEVKRMEKRKWTNHFCSVECLSEFGILRKKDKSQRNLEIYNINPKKCLNCGINIPYKDKSWKKYCSIKCAAIYNQKDGGHCHWSDEDKKRLSILAKNKPNFCGWNKGITYAPTTTLVCRNCGENFIQIISKIYSNKTQTCCKECRNKIQSATLTTQYKNGRKIYGGTTKWLNYKNIRVQGSYEYRTCLILDKWLELNKIKRWEYTKDRFQYIGIDGKSHHYLLDFKIWNNDDSFYYLETKGYEKENDKLKWKSVRDGGFTLQVWFGNDLQKEENDLNGVSSIIG